MKSNTQKFKALLVVAFLALNATANATAIPAHYFVRPFLQSGFGGLIDGLEQNGATSASQNFTNALQSTVDLRDGTVKSYVELSGTNQLGQAGGSMGERLSIHNGTGAAATVDFSFAYDGTLLSSGAAINSGLSGFIFTTLYVYDASVGATWNSFSILAAQALVSESRFQPYQAIVGQSLNEIIDDMLTGSVEISSGPDTTLDVFASLSVSLTTNENPVTVTGDFRNTGTFGISAQPGVTITSSSGVFLKGSTAPVPEPQTLVLLSLGLVGFGWMRRRMA